MAISRSVFQNHGGQLHATAATSGHDVGIVAVMEVDHLRRISNARIEVLRRTPTSCAVDGDAHVLNELLSVLLDLAQVIRADHYGCLTAHFRPPEPAPVGVSARKLYTKLGILGSPTRGKYT